jgi:leucine dehydrogenase
MVGENQMNAAFDVDAPQETSGGKMALTRLSVDNHSAFDGHEEVVYCQDRASGLKAIVAIHSTKLGPALGGCRMRPYASLDDALTDVLRLSQAMSYKHAIANIASGGGKAVIFGDPHREKTPKLMRAFGHFVNELSGRYITAEDVGISVDDMVLVGETTQHVAGLPIELGGSGDPAPFTAYGVFCGIKAAVAFQRRIDLPSLNNLAGVTIAVQGLGNVGKELCRYLALSQAELIVTDVHQQHVDPICEQYGATFIEANEIYDVDANVFAPCALGAILTSTTTARLKARIVAGSANNQLASPEVAEILQNRGILYAPDYVINAGGVINISHEDEHYQAEKAFLHTASIGELLMEIFSRAAAEAKTTADVADELAREKMAGG